MTRRGILASSSCPMVFSSIEIITRAVPTPCTWTRPRPNTTLASAWNDRDTSGRSWDIQPCFSPRDAVRPPPALSLVILVLLGDLEAHASAPARRGEGEVGQGRTRDNVPSAWSRSCWTTTAQAGRTRRNRTSCTRAAGPPPDTRWRAGGPTAPPVLGGWERTCKSSKWTTLVDLAAFCRRLRSHFSSSSFRGLSLA